MKSGSMVVSALVRMYSKRWRWVPRGTLIGRAFVYGLGAMGEAGVSKCLELIANELDLTMAFCGLRDLDSISAEAIWPPDRL